MKKLAQNATAIIARNLPDLFRPEFFRPEVVSLESRTGKLLDVHLKCVHYNGQHYVVLWSDSSATTRQLEKSAENIVHQLVQKLGSTPERITFLLVQEDSAFAFWRWRFQWVGNSPLKPEFKDLNISAQKQLLKSVFKDGTMFSLLRPSFRKVG